MCKATIVCQWGQQTEQIEQIVKRDLEKVVKVFQAMHPTFSAVNEPELIGDRLAYLFVNYPVDVGPDRFRDIVSLVARYRNFRLDENRILFWVLEGHCAPLGRLIVPRPYTGIKS